LVISIYKFSESGEKGEKALFGRRDPKKREKFPPLTVGGRKKKGEKRISIPSIRPRRTKETETH